MGSNGEPSRRRGIRTWRRISRPELEPISALDIEKDKERTVFKVPEASLGPEDQKTTGTGIQNYSQGTKIPDEWVANEVNLVMIFNPKVLQKESASSLFV